MHDHVVARTSGLVVRKEHTAGTGEPAACLRRRRRRRAMRFQKVDRVNSYKRIIFLGRIISLFYLVMTVYVNSLLYLAIWLIFSL